MRRGQRRVRHVAHSHSGRWHVSVTGRSGRWDRQQVERVLLLLLLLVTVTVTVMLTWRRRRRGERCAVMRQDGRRRRYGRVRRVRHRVTRVRGVGEVCHRATEAVLGHVGVVLLLLVIRHLVEVRRRRRRRRETWSGCATVRPPTGSAVLVMLTVHALLRALHRLRRVVDGPVAVMTSARPSHPLHPARHAARRAG